MNESNRITFATINPSFISLPEVINDSIGLPTSEKIALVLQSYEEPNNHLIGAFIGSRLVAMIGFSYTEAKAIIRHISVIKIFQRQKIGKQLIEYIVKHFSLGGVSCETDEESVGFYKSLGFTCESLVGPYCARYLCVLEYSGK